MMMAQSPGRFSAIARTDRPAARIARRRRGMSLMEVMLATVILLGSVMALSRVAFLARRHANAAEDRTQSQIFCQNIMQELLAGVRPLDNVSPELFEGDQWIYSIDAQPVEGMPLAEITVRVQRAELEDVALPSEEEMMGYQLVRWVRAEESSFDALDELETLDGEVPMAAANWVPPERMPIARGPALSQGGASRGGPVQNMRELAFRLRDNLTGSGAMAPIDASR